jgi:hypothetical protein
MVKLPDRGNEQAIKGFWALEMIDARAWELTASLFGLVAFL